jgi:catechol 2,3-dioxygenase-like lactoylglutathione lyase family enzyme
MKINHLIVGSSDVEKSTAFYCDLFEFKKVTDDPGRNGGDTARMDPTSRTLQLLGLLQSRAEWRASDLAEAAARAGAQHKLSECADAQCSPEHIPEFPAVQQHPGHLHSMGDAKPLRHGDERKSSEPGCLSGGAVLISSPVRATSPRAAATRGSSPRCRPS